MSGKSANHRDALRLRGDAFHRLLAFGDEVRLFYPIARGVSADAHFRKDDQTGARGEGLAGVINNLLRVAGKIADRGIDLS